MRQISCPDVSGPCSLGAPPLNSGGSFQGAGAPVLPRRLCPPPSLPWALSVPSPLHCSFSSKNRSSNLGRTINWGEAKSPKDGEALPPLRGRGDGPRRSASCRQVRVRNAVSGGSDSVSAGPRPLPGQLRTCHRTVTRRKHGAAGVLRAFVQRMLRENRSRASGPAQTRDPGRGPWARTLGAEKPRARSTLVAPPGPSRLRPHSAMALNTRAFRATEIGAARVLGRKAGRQSAPQGIQVNPKGADAWEMLPEASSQRGGLG